MLHSEAGRLRPQAASAWYVDAAFTAFAAPGDDSVTDFVEAEGVRVRCA